MKLDAKRKLIMLEVLFAVLMVVSNVVNEKVIILGSVLLPGSAFIYVITFFISNLITEWYGKDEALICLKQGIVCNIVATSIYILVRYLPAQDLEIQNAFVLLLGTNWVFVAADITACVISQYSQITIFSKLRNYVSGQFGNILSMSLSQLIDTFIFLGIAFGLGFSWAFTPEGRTMFLNMFLTQYAVKLAVAGVLTVVFRNFLSKELKGDKNEFYT